MHMGLFNLQDLHLLTLCPAWWTSPPPPILVTSGISKQQIQNKTVQVCFLIHDHQSSWSPEFKIFFLVLVSVVPLRASLDVLSYKSIVAIHAYEIRGENITVGAIFSTLDTEWPRHHWQECPGGSNGFPLPFLYSSLHSKGNFQIGGGGYMFLKQLS